MATKTKKKKTKKTRVKMTLWGVILSYPDLHNPKPFKGKVYYRVDALLELDHPQLKELKSALHKVKVATFGEDKSEWPEAGNPGIEDGNEREDSQGYKGRKYIKCSTQQPVPVVGPDGHKFNPQMVKGGMYGNVAICISTWENDGEVGVAIYLEGVQIDTSKESLNFGGGRSVKEMFNLDDDTDGEDESDEDESSSDEEDDSSPPKKNNKKKRNFDDDEDESDEDDDSEE